MGKNITAQKRGKGSPTYKAPSFRYRAEIGIANVESALIEDIVPSQAHSAPLAKLRCPDGSVHFIPASEGHKVGSTVDIGEKAELALGNTLYLKDIPEGTFVYNIEGIPGDGGKFVRSSGQAARILTNTATKIIVILPSKKKKVFNPKCLATVGVVAGSGRADKPFLKAGKKHHAMKARNKYYPSVSASAMNAVDHPYGNKRTSRKSKAKPAPKNAPPGRKVGAIRPRRTGRKTGKQS
ncbi:50S ribosomal protein L2 [Candidatus Woesearchaeota archaeon]|nr:50S ribosomal protein L2 [Candidatus Woesearchaeota archaeon]